MAALKKKLEVAEQKAKDTASDLQVVIEGKFPRSPQVDSVHLVSSFYRVFDLEWMQAAGRPRTLSRRSWPRSRTR
jgi:hypothetical protein